MDEEQRGVAWAFYARVEQLRYAAGMTLNDLQQISGVRRQTYQELRRTTRRPRRDIVLRVAASVDMDAGEALQLAGLSPVDVDVVRRTIVNSDGLDREQKAALLALLDVYESEKPEEQTPRPRRRLRAVDTVDTVPAVA